MATRNEVLTLFGATPEQIAAKQRQEQMAMVLNQQDPFARAGTAVGLGLARLFGGESPDVLQARELQAAREGIDLSSEEGMREAAKRLQAAGFEDRALQLIDMADRKATAQTARDLEGKVTVNKEIIVPVTTLDDLGNPVTTNVKIDVPYEYDRKTKETTSIFGPEYEQELARSKLAEQGVVTTEDGSTPLSAEERRREEYLRKIDEIPVGQVSRLKNPVGDPVYIRRTGPGPNDVEIVPIEEIRQMPTELGTIGG